MALVPSLFLLFLFLMESELILTGSDQPHDYSFPRIGLDRVT